MILVRLFMRNTSSRRRGLLLLLALGGTVFTFSSVRAQSTTGNSAQQQADTQPSTPPQDPIGQLNLTPEQRVKIRAIREENKQERAAINRRVREAQIAFDEALDADNPSEEMTERRARELGEAQAAAIRMRAVTEIKIRRVLTPEQLRTLRQLRLEVQRARQEQRLENRANQRGGANGRPLPNQRNGAGPLNPQQRRNGLPRRPRP
jgi:Spy/CpxP family protein refolding chaperone